MSLTSDRKVVPIPKDSTKNSAESFAHSDFAKGISYVPEIDPTFIPYGDYEEYKSIIESKNFFPFQIFGLSGCGKTFPIEQACAITKRELVRVPISIETDEDRLIGHYVLENGETKFQYGPVVIAMIRGAVCLLDEFDKAGPKLMCLQPVLEGKPLLIKQTNELIHPKEGFTICTTANTKGTSDETGKYITSNLMDEALLERFVLLYEADFPPEETEKNIILRMISKYGLDPKEHKTFAKCLAKWAQQIRMTYRQGESMDVISTRRIGHIVATYALVTGGKDRLGAIKRCLNRFSPEVAEAWATAYRAIDAECIPKGSIDSKNVVDLGKQAFNQRNQNFKPW
jgi:hypothetical protein